MTNLEIVYLRQARSNSRLAAGPQSGWQRWATVLPAKAGDQSRLTAVKKNLFTSVSRKSERHSMIIECNP